MSAVRSPKTAAVSWIAASLLALSGFSLVGCASSLSRLEGDALARSSAQGPKEGPINARAYAAYMQALEAERIGDLDGAEAMLRRALDNDPTSATLVARHARVRAQQRAVGEAITLTQKAVSMEPTHVAANLQLATLYQFNNQLPEAEKAYRRVIELSPSTEEAWLELANLYRVQGRATEGLTLLEEFQKKGGSPSLPNLMLMAALHKDAGQTEKAEAELLEVLDENSDYPQAQRALLDLYLAQGSIKDAAPRLEALFKSHPWQTWIRETLVQLYARMGDVESIQRMVSGAADSDPEEGDRLRLEAVEELASRREFDKAVTVIEPMLKVSTDDDRALFYAGFLYARRKDYPRALELYAKIPKSSNLYPRALEQRSRVLQQSQKTAEAVALLTSYLKDEPDADDIRSTLIALYTDAHQLDKALETADELLKRNPNDADALSQRASVLQELHRTDEAVASLKKAIEDQPSQIRLYETLAFVLGQEQRTQEAVEVLKKAVGVQPDAESLRFALGAYYDELGQHDEAISQMFKILEFNKNSAQAMNFIGYTWAEQGIRLPEAETYIKRAMELEPNSGYITDSLGWVYYKDGRTAEAVKLLERAVDLSSDEPEILEHLAEAYLKSGDKAKAFQTFRRAARALESNERSRQDDIQRVRGKYESLAKELGKPVEPLGKIGP